MNIREKIIQEIEGGQNFETPSGDIVTYDDGRIVIYKESGSTWTYHLTEADMYGLNYTDKVIKPLPSVVPYTLTDIKQFVKTECMWVINDSGDIGVITGATEIGVFFDDGTSDITTYRELLEEYTWVSGAKCGKLPC